MWLLAVFFVSVLAQQCDSSWPSSVCPPASYLDQLNVTQRDQPSVRLCWEFFSTVSPYALLSAELVANLNRIGERFVNMRDFSERSLPAEYQYAQFEARRAMSSASDAYVALVAHIDAIMREVNCDSIPECPAFVGSFRSAAVESGRSIPIDTVVERNEGAFVISVYSLILLYAVLVLVLAHFVFGSLQNYKLKYYRIMWVGIVVAVILKIIWWVFMTVGMGVQQDIPRIAGAVTYRLGVLALFFTVLLFLFLWIRVYFTVFVVSRFFKIASFIALAILAVGGTLAVVGMTIGAEFGGFDCSVTLLFSLELAACALSAVLTTLARREIKTTQAGTRDLADKIKGLDILLLVELILVGAFVLGFAVSIYVLVQPPQFAGNGWLQFFVMVAVPDVIAFVTLLTLILYNFFKVSKASMEKSSRARTSSTHSFNTDTHRYTASASIVNSYVDIDGEGVTTAHNPNNFGHISEAAGLDKTVIPKAYEI